MKHASPNNYVKKNPGKITQNRFFFASILIHCILMIAPPILYMNIYILIDLGQVSDSSWNGKWNYCTVHVFQVAGVLLQTPGLPVEPLA